MLMFQKFFILVCVPLLIEGEVFTSVAELINIYSNEFELVNKLMEYVRKSEESLMKIKRYVHDYEEIQLEAHRMSEGYHLSYLPSNDFRELFLERLSGNPLYAYKLIKRLATGIRNIKELDPVSEWKVLERHFELSERNGLFNFTVESDLIGAAKGVIRLQDIYNLETNDLVAGRLMGIQSAATLSSEDCLYFGKTSLDDGLYALSTGWFRKALELSASESAVVQNSMAEQMDEILLNMEKKVSSEDLIHHIEKIKVTNGNNLIGYPDLCKGKESLSDQYISTLNCYYTRRQSPYLTLMPIKVEKRHSNPLILMFHDVISDGEIAQLKTLSRTQMTRSGVLSVNGSSDFQDVRVSKVLFLNNEDEGSMKNLYYRMNYLTGLSVDNFSGSAENLQLSNYGVGGHYAPHLDAIFSYKTEEEIASFPAVDIERGDRIATLMFYLSNVERGGATVFPKLGVSLFPEKGSAVFWYNLKKSGIIDEMTLHGGCPVVYGSKWVANKWIRVKQQFQKLPCSLSKEE